MRDNINSFVPLETENHIKKKHKRYGNYIPFGGKENNPFLFIGPDWKFFIGMLSFLSISGGFCCYYSFMYPKSSWSFAGALTITLIELFVYSLTALLDPGIVKEVIISSDLEQQPQQQQQQARVPSCEICKCESKKGRRHCEICDICIDGHDHHCPWTSRCIGEGNIVPFYMFLICTSVFFIYHFLVSLSGYQYSKPPQA